MGYWRWNAGLSIGEIRAQVVRALLQRTNAEAAGPSCSLLPEVQRLERRLQPDRRLGAGGAWLPLQERRVRGERRRYGAQAV